MRGWFERIRAGWLLVVGIALLYFGFSGSSDIVRQVRAFFNQASGEQAYLSDEGFVPYSVPVDENAGSAPALGHSRMKASRTPTPAVEAAGSAAPVHILGSHLPTPEGWVETPIPVLLMAGGADAANATSAPLPTIPPATATPLVTSPHRCRRPPPSLPWLLRCRPGS